jgi:hypothetical protein
MYALRDSTDGNSLGEDGFRATIGQGIILERPRNNVRERLRSHFFRLWTACAVLAAYVYGWLYVPEVLTWWKRTTTALIEAGCDLLPYTWGDRVEATMGNFGLWVQITLAIIVFRILMWLVISVVRRGWTVRDSERSAVLPVDERR